MVKYRHKYSGKYSIYENYNRIEKKDRNRGLGGGGGMF